MAQRKYSKKYCKLKKMNITVLEQAEEEIGRNGVMDWQIRECLNKDDACNSLDCRYVHHGIGHSGSQDPF
jgi:hypothetical protein